MSDDLDQCPDAWDMMHLVYFLPVYMKKKRFACQFCNADDDELRGEAFCSCANYGMTIICGMLVGSEEKTVIIDDQIQGDESYGELMRTHSGGCDFLSCVKSYAWRLSIWVLHATVVESDNRARVYAPLWMSINAQSALEIIYTTFVRRAKEYRDQLRDIGDDIGGGLDDVFGVIVAGYLFAINPLEKSLIYEAYDDEAYDNDASSYSKLLKLL